MEQLVHAVVAGTVVPAELSSSGFDWGLLLGPLSAVGVLGLLYTVWLFWALARLFPALGIRYGYGWIPYANLWQLLRRAGIPAWLVILGFIPGFQLVFFVTFIVAAHRLNVEHGEGAGFTVLAAVLPPLWATLLANRLSDGEYDTTTVRRRSPNELIEYGADGQAYPLLPGAGLPQQTPRYAPPATPAPAAPFSDLPAAAPAAPSGTPQSDEQSAPRSALDQLFDERPAERVPEPQAEQQVVTPSVQQPPAAADAWGFGRTTEDNFRRLAEEGSPIAQQPTFAANETRPFSWPEPQPEPAPRPAVPSQPIAPPQAAAPVVPQPLPAVPPVPQAVAPEPELPSAVTPDAVAPEVATPDAVAPTAAVQPQAAQHPPVSPVQQVLDTASAVPPVVAPPVVAPAPVAPVPAAGGDADRGMPDDLDATIVVARGPRWALELPDGRQLELVGDDIVFGRKPQPVPGAEVLVIPDPTRTLSKSHARLRREGDAWTIEDLNSTNGVFVERGGDHQEIAPGVQAPIVEGIIAGTLELVLRRIDER